LFNKLTLYIKPAGPGASGGCFYVCLLSNRPAASAVPLTSIPHSEHVP
jgi:hypothetical protein